MFTASICLILAMANLFYRDVKYIFDVVITVWMFATAVLYPVSNLGARFPVLLLLNPLTPLIEAYRSVLLRGVLPDALPFLLASVLSLGLLAVAWLMFHRTEFQFAENV